MSQKRNGNEIFCCKCGHYKSVEGSAKEKDGHRKICSECSEQEPAEQAEVNNSGT